MLRICNEGGRITPAGAVAPAPGLTGPPGDRICQSRMNGGMLEEHCEVHKDAPAFARCVVCGRLVCEDCRRVAYNRNFCPYCVTMIPPPVEAKKKEEGPPFPDVKWKIPGAIIMFMVAVAGGLGAEYAIYYGLIRAPGQPLTVQNAVTLLFVGGLVMYALLMAMTFYSVVVRHKSPVSTLGLRWRKVGSSIGLGLLGAYGAYYIAGFIIRPLTPILTKIERKHVDTINVALQKTAQEGINPYVIIMLVVALVILAPLCEEIFFRGYLYPTIRRKTNVYLAVAVGGLLFGLAHLDIALLNLAGLIARTLFGAAMCYLYERQKTLVGPIAGHAFINGFILVLALLFAILPNL